jgi:hypothetical protein
MEFIVPCLRSKILPFFFILSQTKAVYTLLPYFCIVSLLFSHFRLGFPSRLILSDFLTKIYCAFQFFPVVCHVPCPYDYHWFAHLNINYCGDWGYVMAQLVEALRYKPEGGGFDSRWCHWNFLLTQSFRPHHDTEDSYILNLKKC